MSGGMPEGIGVIDLMVGLPRPPGDRGALEALRPLLRDRESLEAFQAPAQHLFREGPKERHADDPVRTVLTEMDRWGVEQALIPVAFDDDAARRALAEHPDRFLGSFAVDPATPPRELRRAVDELGVRAAVAFPAGTLPQTPIDDARWYPLYASCVDLDIPIFVNAGVPGPRLPADTQLVARLEQVCADLPDLRFVTRHGCEPWEDHVIELMRRWPNLYYSTSAFAPRHYPRAIVDYANADGAEKVLYAGYFPMGLSLERIFTELPHVPFAGHVWPLFLRENALHVLRLSPRAS